jgi:hypothetical protein
MSEEIISRPACKSLLIWSIPPTSGLLGQLSKNIQTEVLIGRSPLSKELE